MNKHIVLGAVVLAGLAITGTAFAATYGKNVVMGELFAATANVEVFKAVDGKATCYIAQLKATPTTSAGVSISCVK